MRPLVPRLALETSERRKNAAPMGVIVSKRLFPTSLAVDRPKASTLAKRKARISLAPVSITEG